MPQVEGRHQRNGVVTARHRDPGIVVRSQRSLQAAAQFEVVALLADCGALGLVAGEAEIIGIDGRGLQPVAERHVPPFGIDFVD